MHHWVPAKEFGRRWLKRLWSALETGKGSYRTKLLTTEMTGNSGGLGTEQFVCLCSVRLFFNINTLPTKHRQLLGRSTSEKSNSIWEKTEKYEVPTFLRALMYNNSKKWLRWQILTCSNSPMLPPAWRWRNNQSSQKGPSFSSSGGDERCRSSAPYCETLNQTGTSIPNLPRNFASAEETNEWRYSKSALLFFNLLFPIP